MKRLWINLMHFHTVCLDGFCFSHTPSLYSLAFFKIKKKSPHFTPPRYVMYNELLSMYTVIYAFCIFFHPPPVFFLQTCPLFDIRAEYIWVVCVHQCMFVCALGWPTFCAWPGLCCCCCLLCCKGGDPCRLPQNRLQLSSWQTLTVACYPPATWRPQPLCQPVCMCVCACVCLRCTLMQMRKFSQRSMHKGTDSNCMLNHTHKLKAHSISYLYIMPSSLLRLLLLSSLCLSGVIVSILLHQGAPEGYKLNINANALSHCPPPPPFLHAHTHKYTHPLLSNTSVCLRINRRTVGLF